MRAEAGGGGHGDGEPQCSEAAGVPGAGVLPEKSGWGFLGRDEV